MPTKKQMEARREVAYLISRGGTGWLEWMTSQRVKLGPVMTMKSGRQMVTGWIASYVMLGGDGWTNISTVWAQGASPIEALMKLAELPRPRRKKAHPHDRFYEAKRPKKRSKKRVSKVLDARFDVE